MSSIELERVGAQLRWLKVYCIAVTCALATLLLIAAARPNHFEELSVERLNVVEASGKIRLAISNAARFPPVILKGQTYKRSVNPAGLVFFNEAGDEVGGLALGDPAGGRLSALVFDYTNYDAVAMITRLGPDESIAGFTINSRPDPNLTAPQASKVVNQRVALQNRDETAELVLSDKDGKPRLRLQVAPDGTPRIEMLDAKGEVSSLLPR
jgi:hypothetical protein